MMVDMPSLTAATWTEQNKLSFDASEDETTTTTRLSSERQRKNRWVYRVFKTDTFCTVKVVEKHICNLKLLLLRCARHYLNVNKKKHSYKTNSCSVPAVDKAAKKMSVLLILILGSTLVL